MGCGIYILYRQSQKRENEVKSSEIRALVSSSEGLFASNRRLDALVEAIKAKQRLKKLPKLNANLDYQVKAEVALNLACEHHLALLQKIQGQLRHFRN